MATTQEAAEVWVRVVEFLGRYPLPRCGLNRRAFYDEARRVCGGQEPVAYFERLAKFMGLRGGR